MFPKFHSVFGEKGGKIVNRVSFALSWRRNLHAESSLILICALRVAILGKFLVTFAPFVFVPWEEERKKLSENYVQRKSLSNDVIDQILFQSCPANGVSRQWHKDEPYARKWSWPWRILRSHSKVSAGPAAIARSTVVKQRDDGIRKGELRWTTTMVENLNFN